MLQMGRGNPPEHSLVGLYTNFVLRDISDSFYNFVHLYILYSVASISWP